MVGLEILNKIIKSKRCRLCQLTAKRQQSATPALVPQNWGGRTFLKIFKAFSVNKSGTWKHSAAYGNYRQPTAMPALVPKIWGGRTFKNVP